MLKKKKTQFAIRKLKTGAGVLLISLGLLVNTAAPVLADSNQETAISETNSQQTAPVQNSEPVQEAATAPAFSANDQAAEKRTQETPAVKSQPTAPAAPEQASSPSS